MKKKGSRQRDMKSSDSRRSRDQRDAPRTVEADALAQVTGGDDDNIVWGQF